MHVFVSETQICEIIGLQQRPVSPTSSPWAEAVAAVPSGFRGLFEFWILHGFGKGQVDRVRGGKVGGETSNTTKNGGLAFGGACRSAVALSGGTLQALAAWVHAIHFS